jgi:hypothetical protein
MYSKNFVFTYIPLQNYTAFHFNINTLLNLLFSCTKYMHQFLTAKIWPISFLFFMFIKRVHCNATKCTPPQCNIHAIQFWFNLYPLQYRLLNEKSDFVNFYYLSFLVEICCLQFITLWLHCITSQSNSWLYV